MNKTFDKTVVELDLVGYSTVCDNLEQGLDVTSVAQLNQQIQGFIDAGLKVVGAPRDQTVIATTGDGAILLFDSAQDAHRFCEAVHLATREHNRTRSKPLAKRVFRSGAATGEIVIEPKPGGGFEIAGMTIARAKRLEARATPGSLLVDERTHDGLSVDYQCRYGKKARVPGKRDEQFDAYPCHLNSDGAEDAAFFNRKSGPENGLRSQAGTPDSTGGTLVRRTFDAPQVGLQRLEEGSTENSGILRSLRHHWDKFRTPRWRRAMLLALGPLYGLFTWLSIPVRMGEPSWDSVACYWMAQMVRCWGVEVRSTNRLVLVRLDDDLARTEPILGRLVYPRTNFVRLLQQTTNATAIFLDLCFEGNSSEPKNDGILANAISNHGRVFLAERFSTNPQGEINSEFVQPLCTNLAEAGIPVIASLWEKDGRRIRRLVTQFGNPSLISAAWRIAASDARDFEFPEPALGEWLWLNYCGSQRPKFSSLALKDAEQRDTEYFRDRFVLVGDFSNSDEFFRRSDRHPNAFGKEMFGVEFHALALENFLSAAYWRNLNPLLSGLMAGAWGWLVFCWTPESRRKRIGLIVLGTFSCVGLGVLVPVFLHVLWAWLVPVFLPLVTGLVLFPPHPPLPPLGPRVFVSYKTQPEAQGQHVRAMLLKRELELRGVHHVWLAPEDLRPGEDWWEQARKEIETSDNFLLLLDSAVMKALNDASSPVRKEVDLAWKRRERSNGLQFLILTINRSVVIEREDPFPLGWSADRWEEFGRITGIRFDDSVGSRMSNMIAEVLEAFNHDPNWKPTPPKAEVKDKN